MWSQRCRWNRHAHQFLPHILPGVHDTGSQKETKHVICWVLASAEWREWMLWNRAYCFKQCSEASLTSWPLGRIRRDEAASWQPSREAACLKEANSMCKGPEWSMLKVRRSLCSCSWSYRERVQGAKLEKCWVSSYMDLSCFFEDRVFLRLI